MSYWMDFYLRQEQAIDRQQESVHHRLVRQVKAAKQNDAGKYTRMVTAIGHRLMAWGQWAVSQYSTERASKMGQMAPTNGALCSSSTPCGAPSSTR